MLGLGVVIGLLVGVVAGSSAPLWGPAVGFADQRLLVVLAASWAGLGAITGCSLALLRSQDRIGPYAAVGLLQSVVAEFLSLGLVLLVAPTAEAFVWGQVIAQAAACLLGLVLAPPGLPRWRDRDLLREGLALGIPLVPAMLGGFVLNAADRLMINGQLGEEAVGRYQVAYNIGALPELVIGLLTSVWMPRFFAVADDHRDAVLDASRDALYRLLCPVMIGMAVAAPILLRLWAPAEYRTDELVLLTTVIVVMAVPYTAAMAATRVLLTRSDTRVIAYAAMVAAVSNVVLNLLLIPVWGLMGSAVATVAGFSVQHLVLLSRVGRRASRAPLHRRPWLYVLVGCAAAFATVPLPLGADGSVFRMVLAVLCLGWFGWELRRTAMGAEPAAAATRG
jgi:O-antigen/teichoic acid export membrane protein